MQGGLQLAATFWSIGMGMLSSVATALIFYFTTDLSAQQVYADIVFTEACDAHEEKGPAPAHSATIQWEIDSIHSYNFLNHFSI